MNEWDPPTFALLEAARHVSPPEDAKALVRRRLAATLAATAAGGTVAAASSPWLGAKLAAAVKAGCAVLPGAGATSTASTSALLFGPVVVGVALGLSALAPTSVDAPPPRQTLTEPVVAEAKNKTARARVAEPSMVPPVLERAETSTGEPTRAPVRTSTKAAPPRNDFAAQSELIERARVVLRQGDTELSLRALSEYRRLYPQGMFFVEVMMLEAQALCTAGRLGEGQSRLQRLEATGTPSAALQTAKQKCAMGKEP